jgi:hypothetical protein
MKNLIVIKFSIKHETASLSFEIFCIFSIILEVTKELNQA